MTTRSHIEITPGVCGGQPRIAGHRIRVQDVAVWHESLGLSVAEIVAAAGEAPWKLAAKLGKAGNGGADPLPS